MFEMTLMTRVTFFALVFGLLATSCSGWPPYERRLTESFNRYRSDFTELSDLLQASNYSEAFFGVKPNTIGTRSESGMQMVTVSGVKAGAIRSKLEKLHVYGVIRTPTTTRYELAPLKSGTMRYLISYNYSRVGSKLGLCGNSAVQSSDQRCQVPLDHAWWIEYAYNIHETKVLLTLLDGEIVYERD